MNTTSKGLCKDCRFRFRRVFIPLNPGEFQGENSNCVLDKEENIVIMNMCLTSDMDLDLDSTVECSHFRPKEERAVPFFKHI